MATDTPVLEIDAARGAADIDDVPSPALSLRLMPGEVALIDVRDPRRATWFADLCTGLVALSSGRVSFLGRDWNRMPPDYADGLRGRIGRVFTSGGWVGFLDLSTNIMLAQLHHTRTSAAALRAEATRLAAGFGLPGLPLSRPAQMSPGDLARAACVRAFLGEPMLLLLERPTQGRFPELWVPLLNALAAARGRGAAAIWLTHDDMVLSDRTFPADHRLRLHERGLVAARRVPA